MGSVPRTLKEVLVMRGHENHDVQDGADPGRCIGRWIVEHPEFYRDLFHDYFRVGYDIVSVGAFNLKERFLGILLDRIAIFVILISKFLYYTFGSRNI